MENQPNIWILLADTRKNLLWLWLGFTAVIICLFLFMTVSGATEGVEKGVWLWVFISLLPMLALLFWGVLSNPNPSKVLKRSTYYLVFYGALGYLLLTLGTLLGLQAWLDAHPERGIGDYFVQSYLWLLPFQILLLVGAWILYFQKTKLLQPDEDILLQYAQKKADYAKRYGSLAQQEAFDLLVNDKMPALFELIKLQLKGKSEQNEVILLESNYNRVKETHNLDTEDPVILQRELNKISVALIDYVEKI